jgi:hypothetical protein
VRGRQVVTTRAECLLILSIRATITPITQLENEEEKLPKNGELSIARKRWIGSPCIQRGPIQCKVDSDVGGVLTIIPAGVGRSLSRGH